MGGNDRRGERAIPGAVPEMIVRRGGPHDARFLRDMLHHAYYWRERAPDAGPGPVALYVKGWGRRGDTALIGVDEGFPVGAAWYRLFSPATPGYGFVDERTPELAIAVVPSRRGRGVGPILLDALIERAAADGHAGISLSVDRSNEGAIGLYESRGFTRSDESGDSLTMRATLPAAAG